MSAHHFNRIMIRSNDSLLNVAKKLLYCCPANGIRHFSTKDPLAGGDGNQDVDTKDGRPATIPINVKAVYREINLFGPKDHRTPLPGNVGLASVMDIKKMAASMTQPLPRRVVGESDVMTEELNIDRQARIIDQLIWPREESEPVEDRVMKAQEILECTAHQCPELMIRDFKTLFPRVKIGNRLTVITICQKTKYDMSKWSQPMETERDQLAIHFVTLANSIVNTLSADGFWADFIDPMTGKSTVTGSTDTLYETDVRYKNFGFEIEDKGCCKVLSHHEWGSRAFVGSIFTTAPFDSPELLRIVDHIKDPSFDGQ